MVKRIKSLSSTGKPLIITGCMPNTEIVNYIVNCLVGNLI